MIASHLGEQIVWIYVSSAIFTALVVWPLFRIGGWLRLVWLDWQNDRRYRRYLALSPAEQAARRREIVERYRAASS